MGLPATCENTLPIDIVVYICVYVYMAEKRKQEAPQRTTMFLNPTLHKRLKHLAVDRGVTVTAIVTEALEAYVARAEREEGRKRS
jgi:hypothetical protein